MSQRVYDSLDLYGGNVLGSGGYGCIFYPALKCSKEKTPYNGVSKLMKKKYADIEFKEYMTLTPIIKKIPKYKNYFLLGNIKKCAPREIPHREIVKSKKCDKILEITNRGDGGKLRKFLKTQRRNYSIINMPNGGVSLVDWLEERSAHGITSNDIAWFSKKIKELIKNAVVPMNKLGVIHNDLKSDNLLTLGGKVRLVDWGLSFQIPRKRFVIPYRTTKYIIQFNVPPSNILFSMLSVYPIEVFKSMESSRENIKKYIIDYCENNGEGHKKYIEDYILPAFFPEGKDYYEFLTDYIEIIIRGDDGSTRGGAAADAINRTFNVPRELSPHMVSFFTNDYYKVCDIYGMLSCFFDILSYKQYTNATNVIRELFVDYVWKNPRKLDLNIIYKYIDRISDGGGVGAARNVFELFAGSSRTQRRRARQLRKTVQTRRRH